jgi:hypothetical protein
MRKMATKKTTERTIEVKSKVKKTIEAKSKEVKKQSVEQKVENLPKVENLSKPIEVPVKKPKVETKQKPAGFEKQPSAGKQIRELFINNLSKLTDKEMEILTSAEKTKEVLKIRYAFLKEATENKDDRKVNGNARYGAKTITINDKSYWCCNDLYERNIDVFKAWIETLK